MTKAKKRPTARPPKRERPGSYVGFRAPDELKRQLETAASLSSRSLSSEAQFRLERSFQGDDFTRQALSLAYGPHVAALTLMIARALHQAGTMAAFAERVHSGAQLDWQESPYAYDEACRAAAKILDARRPAGKIEAPGSTAGLPRELAAVMDAHIGEVLAAGLIDAVVKEGRTAELEYWAKPLRDLLAAKVKS